MSKRLRNAADWESVKLADVAIFRGGNGFPERYQGHSGGRYPFIKVADLNDKGNERVVRNARNWLSDEAFNRIRPTLHPAGAIVFAKVGAALKLNRRRVLTRPTAIDNNMMSVAPGERLDPWFLFALMQTVDMAEFCQDGGLPSVNQTNLGQFTFLLPPLDEQRRIAAAVEAWDDAIATTERLIETKRRRQAILRQRLFSLAVPDEMSELGEICRPRQWPTPGKNALTDKGVPVYGANGFIGFIAKPTHHELTIAVGCRGSVGEVHRVMPPAYITGNAMALDDLNAQRAFLPFLYHQLKYVGFADATSGTSQPQITQADMRAKSVWLPALNQQKAIGQTLDTAEEEIGTLEKLTDILRIQKRGLMQKLLTGEWRLPEGAEALILGGRLAAEAAE